MEKAIVEHIIKKFVRNLSIFLSPVKENHMVFDISPSGMDNSESLMDYIRLNCVDVRISVWTRCREDWELFQKKYRSDKRFTVFMTKYRPFYTYWCLFTSKYVFFTNRSILHTADKRTGQIIVNLWHGCGYKDIQNPDKRWIDGTMFDYVLVPGNVFIKTKAAFFNCKKEQILAIGYPRYDMIMKRYPKIEQGFRKHHFKKLIVWMPTFRQMRGVEIPGNVTQMGFDLPLLADKEELQQLNSHCVQKGIFLCIKKHPEQVPYSCEDIKLSNVAVLDNAGLQKRGIQTCELLAVADALISDYSSTAFDYLLMDRPIAFALADFKQYKEKWGFVFDNPLKYMPGHHLYTFADMKVFIDDVAYNRDPYKEERYALMPEVHNVCDNYCGRIWEILQTLNA